MDRISNLPDDLIGRVISFLSAKDATCLKYTSKKWLNLVTIIPTAVFVDSSSSPIAISGSFKDFADRLLLARDAFHRIRRFSLKLPVLDFAQYDIVNKCLCNAFQCGVLDLELDINVRGDYSLPFQVFTCKSLVKLKLGSGFVIDSLPKNALLPALKTLLLDSVQFHALHGCAFQRLLSVCPVLEELLIYGHNCEDWKWSRTVSSQILKRLTIRRECWDHDDYSLDPISLDTPNLEYFEYFDVLRDKYPVVNLNSLVEAKLELPPLYCGETYDVTNLINGLKNVQILCLGAVDTTQLFCAFREAVPMFENLFHLSVSTQDGICWDPLLILLEKSPNLKTLTIEDLHYYGDSKTVCECLEGYCFLLSCPIEILKITRFKGDMREMEQIKHILENLQCLVLLEIHVKARRDGKKLKILADLLMLPRASSKCKVQVKFF